ncbi:2-hydroxychromene-2-carboxylate isomerase [Hyphococcus luteus]|uniref:2-hydroxychromene-2-carboxylate isomerase n=1 Tax=Hyphococcus luteus TaxID=2058213 RepID=A0A2S7K7J4_9PROT|nr:2-hydroxychromene-2-carboxylate isomerase [Marinicaulis flavus]PQA88484.1 2-hydroxychromene-2-carboxylate isomerase [Marinicaulis flavus]
MPKPVDFWFDFASTYAYLAAAHLEEAAAARGIETRWRPILLGPIFALHGWDTSPFVVYPLKGRYMWRDVERRAAKLGRPFRRPDANDPREFPQHTVLAARMALIALDGPYGKEFCRRVFFAEFEEGRDISDPAVLSAIARGAGLPADLADKATTPDNKARLRAQVEAAKELGIFGAPSFTVGEELFWGEDRIDDALEWALDEQAC